MKTNKKFTIGNKVTASAKLSKARTRGWVIDAFLKKADDQFSTLMVVWTNGQLAEVPANLVTRAA